MSAYIDRSFERLKLLGMLEFFFWLRRKSPKLLKLSKLLRLSKCVWKLVMQSLRKEQGKEETKKA